MMFTYHCKRNNLNSRGGGKLVSENHNRGRANKANLMKSDQKSVHSRISEEKSGTNQGSDDEIERQILSRRSKKKSEASHKKIKDESIRETLKEKHKAKLGALKIN